MARARNIKPAFFQNQELGELQPIDRLAFIGMWTIADFRGCIELKLKRLKIQILPYDDCSIESIVNNLEKARFIRTYSVQGQSYIKIINFEKHQNPHKNEREAGSEIPDISEAEEKSNEIKELNKDGTKPDLIGTTRADSLSLIPDSPILIPDSLIPSTSVEPLAGDTPKPKKPAAKKEPAPTTETWNAYAAAYERRYRVPPVRNAAVNGQLSQLVYRLGAIEAPQVAAWYVNHQNQFYVGGGHSVGLLLRDCEKLRTQWATGRQVTATQALQADKTQTNLSAFSTMIEEAKGREHAVS
ncbi:MAG: hypothetical protein GX466_08435 [Candidatus Cloacimonetes bacterium]|nr:hypothetical protein [Candidatus Cloacimonadota bacterium]